MKTLTKRNFQNLIITQAVLIIIVGLFYSVSETYLPLELQNYIQNTNNLDVDYGIFISIVGIFFIPLLLWTLQNLYALYKFRRYARTHALYLTLIWIASYFLFPLEADVSISAINSLISLSDLLWGLTLGIIFFSNLATEFDSNKTIILENTETSV